jgi:hypothetical protein
MEQWNFSVVNLFVNCNGIIFRYWRARTPRAPTKLQETTMKTQQMGGPAKFSGKECNAQSIS